MAPHQLPGDGGVIPPSTPMGIESCLLSREQPPADHELAPLIRHIQVTEWKEAFEILGSDFLTRASEESELKRLVAGIAYLQCFLHLNWTGPTIEDETWKTATPLDEEESEKEMGIDGELMHGSTKGIALLRAARQLLFPADLKDLNTHPITLPSAAIWRGRLAFVWQRSLAEASDRGCGHSHTLMQWGLEASAMAAWGWFDAELEGLFKNSTTVPGPAIVNDRIKGELVLELSQRYHYYAKMKVGLELAQSAAELLKFKYEITGVSGIRRKYQQDAHA